ncbi:hypothetical protein L1887_60638 [Cichorium endivia]|nr:hypothetical protein L1887_60638 [Cichorium endivia]
MLASPMPVLQQSRKDADVVRDRLRVQKSFVYACRELRSVVSGKRRGSQAKLLLADLDPARVLAAMLRVRYTADGQGNDEVEAGSSVGCLRGRWGKQGRA